MNFCRCELCLLKEAITYARAKEPDPAPTDSQMLDWLENAGSYWDKKNGLLYWSDDAGRHTTHAESLRTAIRTAMKGAGHAR